MTPSILLKSSNKGPLRIPPRRIEVVLPSASPAKSTSPLINNSPRTLLVNLKDEQRRLKDLRRKEEHDNTLKRKEKREKEKENKLKKIERMSKRGLDYNGNPLPLSSSELNAIAERRNQEAESIRERSRSKSCSSSVEPRELSESPRSIKSSSPLDIEASKKVAEGSGSRASTSSIAPAATTLQRTNSFQNSSSKNNNVKKRKVKSELIEGSENLSIPNKKVRREEKSSSVESVESFGL